MKNSIKHTKDLLILSMVFILSSVFSNILANNINSEDIKVSGVVQDQTGVELPGVSISVKVWIKVLSPMLPVNFL